MPAGPINILLIGGGGREHALAARLAASPRLGTLWIAHPQNPGLAALGRAVDVPVSTKEAYRTIQFCDKHDISLIVIGPEDPLAEGMADKLRSDRRLVFGPGADGARLEADKSWSKQLMRGASIPTAESRTFTDPEAARNYVESRVQGDGSLERLFTEAAGYPNAAARRDFINRKRANPGPTQRAYDHPRPNLPVIKASGLAKGKGVVLPANLAEAMEAIERIMVERVFGDSGREVVLEERLAGPEVSVFALVDGRNIYILETCQDHKRLGDHDTGPNTGGMGAFCPSPLVDDALMQKLQEQILVPTMDALRREGIDYRGVVYAGIILTPGGPKVLEYNCRFGDPECQALMARLDSDIVDLLIATCTGKLDEADVRWSPGASCCVVLASEGYPEEPKKGRVITGVEEAGTIPGVTVYHAGTARDAEGRLVTAGGRVLGVTARGKDLAEARKLAYDACSRIHFDGMQFRRDIGAPEAAGPKPPPTRHSPSAESHGRSASASGAQTR